MSNYEKFGTFMADPNILNDISSSEVIPYPSHEFEFRSDTEQQNLFVEKLGRGYAWLDTGTHESLLEAHQFIQIIEHRQGLKISCPEEISFKKNWITFEQLEKLAVAMKKNGYSEYLMRILNESSLQ